MDEGFAAYSVRGEGSLSKVQDSVMHFVVMYDDESFVVAAKSVTYGEGLREAVKYLKVRRG